MLNDQAFNKTCCVLTAFSQLCQDKHKRCARHWADCIAANATLIRAVTLAAI